jgi:hypothetical protein
MSFNFQEYSEGCNSPVALHVLQCRAFAVVRANVRFAGIAAVSEQERRLAASRPLLPLPEWPPRDVLANLTELSFPWAVLRKVKACLLSLGL